MVEGTNSSYPSIPLASYCATSTSILYSNSEGPRRGRQLRYLTSPLLFVDDWSKTSRDFTNNTETLSESVQMNYRLQKKKPNRTSITIGQVTWT